LVDDAGLDWEGGDGQGSKPYESEGGQDEKGSREGEDEGLGGPTLAIMNEEACRVNETDEGSVKTTIFNSGDFVNTSGREESWVQDTWKRDTTGLSLSSSKLALLQDPFFNQLLWAGSGLQLASQQVLKL